MGISRLAVVLVLLGTAGSAAAQSAEAETLFREGKKLVKEGKLVEGCAKLEASERIESSTGTLLNLGECREKNHQLASAWAAFVKATSAAKRANDAKRESEARRRATDLEGKLAMLTITVKARVEGLEIKRGEDIVDQAVWNSEVPVDAGTYQVTANAPGFRSWSGSVTAKDGAKAAIEVPALERTLVATPPPTTSGSHEPSAKAPLPPPAHPGTFTGLRKVSIVLAVVGVAGLAAGTKLGLDSRDEEKRSNSICPMAACTDAGAVQLDKDAQHHASLANIGLIGGGVAIVGAVVLWFVGAPSASTGEFEKVTVVPAHAGATVAFTAHF